jgi:hypothetical protein
MSKVGIVKFSIVAAVGHQVIVRAFFDDPALLHDNGPVGVLA